MPQTESPAADEPEPHASPVENRIREPLSVFLLLLVCLSAVTGLKPDADPDIWARMAVGKLVLESGEVTRTDPFSYTQKRPEWIDHEWGAGVVFYLVASLAGQRGLLVLKALLMFGTLAFMYLRARRATGRPPSLLYHVLLVAALYFGFLASVRAQAFTFFLFSAWLYLLERARDGDWRLAWLIPLSGVVWANLHGGFLAGVGLIVLFATGAFIQGRNPGRFALLAAAAGVGSLLNPYGLDYWTYLTDATTMSRTAIAEWQSMNFFGPEGLFLGFKVLLVLSVVAFVTGAMNNRLPDMPLLVTLVVTAVLGLRVLRHLTFFVIASAPFVWAWMAGAWQGTLSPAAVRFGLRIPPVAEAAYYGLSRGLLLVVTILTLATTPLRIVLFRVFPVRAIDFIAQNGLRGNLLVHFNFGSYAIWRLFPACRVSMDGRYETVYLDSTVEEVRNFFRGAPGWNELLDRYPHDIIVAQRNQRMEENMTQRTDWVVAFEDEGHRVYVRHDQQRAWPPLAPPSREDPFSTLHKPKYVP